MPNSPFKTKLGLALSALMLALPLAGPAAASGAGEIEIHRKLSADVTMVTVGDYGPSWTETACVNAKNPLTGKYMREAELPRDEITASFKDAGVWLIRVEPGACLTRFIGIHDGGEILKVYSTVTGEHIFTQMTSKAEAPAAAPAN